jgi:hypothetical protein
MRWRCGLWLLLLPGALAAQDWSGASLRAAPTLRLPPGYRLEVVAVGFPLPQDLAVESAGAVWLLGQADRAGGGAGTLVRIPLDAPGPLQAASLPAISIPFADHASRFRVGSLARHPATGLLFVAEQSGHHVFRVTPEGDVVLYARGLDVLAAAKALAVDVDGRLVVLDFAGRAMVADPGTTALRELFGDADRYVGPVLHRLRVDEARPLPRNLAHVTPFFPPRALRQRGAALPRYPSLVALATGDLALSGPAGEIDRLRPDGTLVPIARVPAARVLAAGPDGELYAVDSLGGRIFRVGPDGTVEPFVEGLVRPAALAVLPDGSLVVAQDTMRVVRLRPGAGQ